MKIATPNGSILAIDLGKYKSVACLYEPVFAQATFVTLPTTRAELRHLIESCRPAVVVTKGGAADADGWAGMRNPNGPCRSSNSRVQSRRRSSRWSERGRRGPASLQGIRRIVWRPGVLIAAPWTPG